ncbi:uncharacterized protein LOC135150328 [Daucus carota subsp. sativus]
MKLQVVSNFNLVNNEAIRYEVGMNSAFSFWHDPWIRGASLINLLHPSTISTLQSSSDALAGQFMDNGSWHLPTSNHFDCLELRSLVLNIQIHPRDKIRWDTTQSNATGISTIWNSIRTIGTPPAWVDVVWHNLSIPKCAFTFWLAIKGRLLTRDRMHKFNMNTELRCILCNIDNESHRHIFVSCPYIMHIMANSSFTFSEDWSHYKNGEFLVGPVTGTRKQMGHLYAAITFFLVWKGRNARLHNATNQPASMTLTLVKRMFREKLHSCHRFQKEVLKNHDLLLDLY